MSPRIPLPWTLACVAPLMVAAQSPTAPSKQRAQFTMRERIIIRIPRLACPEASSRVTSARPAPVVRWKEHRGPRCVAVVDLTGAAISSDGDIDLATVQGTRLRAKLGEDCAALDFYSGFYVKPTADGRLCADRDAIRARSGRSCPIERFRKLTASW